MIFGLAILLTALTLSGVAAYYSVVGLMTIFSAAPIPVMIMGAALEIGKIMSTVFLHNSWRRLGWTYKLYLVPAIVVLMFLTSIGVFGLLSKAHLDQSVVGGDIVDKLAILDERIRTEKSNIESARQSLKQMDSAVDQLMARTTDEQGAQQSANLRRSQRKERAQLQDEIATAQKKVAALNEERAPLATQVRRVEADVGPIKYVAALIYGDNPDVTLLERSVRYIIILIVVVFDPLALCLILAANKQFSWAREDRKAQQQTLTKTAVAETPQIITPTVIEPDTVISATVIPETAVIENAEPSRPQEPVQAPVDQEPIVPETPVSVPTHTPEAMPGRGRGIMYSTPATADNVTPSRSGFGNQFPNTAVKGDLFIRTDFLPNRLFKFNGVQWIEVDKNQTDVYAFDESYIKHLIENIERGTYDIENLTEIEQQQIKEYLNK